MRVSTIGVAEDKSYEVQDRFIRDFYEALAPQNRAFFFGGDRTYAQASRGTRLNRRPGRGRPRRACAP